MFTVEIRINGNLISHIYGHNEEIDNLKNDLYKYSYRFYNAETGKLISGNINHKRDSGINKLVTLILNDVEKGKKK